MSVKCFWLILSKGIHKRTHFNSLLMSSDTRLKQICNNLNYSPWVSVWSLYQAPAQSWIATKVRSENIGGRKDSPVQGKPVVIGDQVDRHTKVTEPGILRNNPVQLLSQFSLNVDILTCRFVRSCEGRSQPSLGSQSWSPRSPPEISKL